MKTEALWKNTFGDTYTERNDIDYGAREGFLGPLIKNYRVGSFLEVGCNTGMNLGIVSRYLMDPDKVWGVDVNHKAITTARSRHPNINTAFASGYDLPFRDDYFDMVFTAGVLIHQEPGEAEKMMQEIIRVSGEYVVALEYYSVQFENIPYRGNDLLWKGPYGEIYEQRYGLRLLEHDQLSKEEGWDNVDVWILSKH